MPYTAEISRANPTCFLFLIDQSGSMAERWGGDAGKTKAEGVADAINRLLETLVTRCSKGDYIADRYYVGLIGYGGEVSLGFPDRRPGGQRPAAGEPDRRPPACALKNAFDGATTAPADCSNSGSCCRCGWSRRRRARRRCVRPSRRPTT